jgi:uncharacterized protein YbcC (UPF0753/DUF2309 family)
MVRDAAHLLPAQGPIGVFVHHNTLHAFQDRPFEQAVSEASRIYGAEPFMSEEAYRRELLRNRIRPEDLEAVLSSTPDREILPGGLTRRRLRLAILAAGSGDADPATLEWDLEEGRLARPPERELFAACFARIQQLPVRPAPDPPPARYHDLNDTIHPFLIRLCGAFLDQGMAYWPMPARELGFYECVREICRLPGLVEPEGLAGLAEEFDRQNHLGYTAEDAVGDGLAALRIPEDDLPEFIQRELLALPGWAGMFHRLEEQPELAPHVHLRVSLMDYLAVRITMIVVAGRCAGPLPAEPEPTPDALRTARIAAARLSLAAGAAGLSPADITALPADIFRVLCEEAERFDAWERRRVFHLAYERRHELEILPVLEAHRRSIRPEQPAPRPAAQVFFCLDEREESMRRHLEETDPAIETFGAAGYFGVAIDYAGIDDARSVALCPVVVKPRHAIRELPLESDARVHAWRTAVRKLVARLLHTAALSSRQLVRGWLATAALGIFSLFPLVLRVLTPRTYARLRERLNEIIVPRPETELSFTRAAGESIEGLGQGFSPEEKAERVYGVLAGAGLTRNFARLVAILGHGSTSLNNPHESAHDCGACGGRRGGPNARLFAAMANRPHVRQELARRGVVIPDDTWFIGGQHDSASDDIEFYDLHQLPETHREDLARLQRSLDRARAANAHERARRFEHSDPEASPQQALRHVEERSEHLAEPRPEYGHCTNAVCVVGRRAITRGLFLDRRAFLVSYDPTQDPAGEHLSRQLNAVVPVCAGISLEYYFSFVDNEVYGCGTKLPHNVTGLLGVMNGHASDLRTGLPWQMVEIHEPVRALFVVETTPQHLIAAVDASPAVRELVRNEWIRLAAMDPHTGAMHVFRNGRFELLEEERPRIPAAESSAGWYRGHMHHLPIARIGDVSEAA